MCVDIMYFFERIREFKDLFKYQLSSLSCSPGTCVKGNGRYYQGHVNTTRGGLSCQPWYTDTPHNHTSPPPVFPEVNIVMVVISETSAYLLTSDAERLQLLPERRRDREQPLVLHHGPPRQVAALRHRAMR